MDYYSYDWVNNVTKACDGLESLTKKMREHIKNDDSFVLLKETADNAIGVINKIKSEVLSERENNFCDYIDKLTTLGIITFLAASRNKMYYSIVGLENNVDKRCIGFCPGDFRYMEKNKVYFVCKIFKAEGVMENDELENKIDAVLKANISDENITWDIRSFDLRQYKKRTSAEVEISFQINN